MSEIQSVLFRRDRWAVTEAVRWLDSHHFTVKKIDATPALYRFRQHDPSRFRRFITKKFAGGIYLVIGFY